MKIYLSQLKSHLAKKQLAPIYIISGEELWQKNDAIQTIRETARATGILDREKFSPANQEEDWQRFYTALYSHSLLANKRLIELDLHDHMPNKTAGAILQTYAAQPLPDILLLINLGKIDDKTAKSSWYQTLEKIAVIVTVWPVPRDQLPRWIIQRAKEYPFIIPPDAAGLIAEFVEGNIAAAAQAVEKLYLLHNQQPIDAALVMQVLHDANQFTVFDLVDGLLTGQAARCLHILKNLQQCDTEPVLILWSITRELRLLAELAEAQQAGSPPAALFKKFAVFPRRQPLITQCLKRLQAKECYQLLTHAMRIENMIKGGIAGDPWQALQQFCLRWAV